MIPDGDMLLTMTLAPTVSGQNLCGYVLELTVPPSIGRGYIVFDLDPMEVSVNVCNVYRTNWQFFLYQIYSYILPSPHTKEDYKFLNRFSSDIVSHFIACFY